MPTIILQALTKDEIRLGEIHSTRDMNYVLDIVSGFIACAEAGEEVIGENINVGSGREVSIQQLKDEILKCIGVNKPAVIEERRMRPKNSEVMRLIASNEKAKKLLKWRPSYTLERGLSETINWFKEYSKNYSTENYMV
jgi:dTDP-glucose 4,6-dehydratase